MLENSKINIRIKLAALWTSLLFLFIYGDYFEMYTPGKVENLMNVTDILDSPFKLFMASFVLAIPSLMIALTILMKPNVNRILNITFGTFFTLVVLLVGGGSITPWYSFYVFYAALEAILAIAIVRQAWKWPREISV
ncbi:MAG: hypothetical protein ACI8XB_001338 [Patiriisocius sp.]|jgi:hypothetical protein